MPCVATNSYEVIFNCIDAIKEYWNAGGKGVLGLHVEGPWINKEKKGAHIESYIHSPTVEQVKHLLEYGKNVIRIITLAPEVCSKEVIRLIQLYGVVISAGHSNATFQQAAEVFDEGIHTATHLFNAMSALQHRSPGLPGAIFHNNTVMASIIADGYHVNFEMISIAKKILQQRLFLITDAVTETNIGYYQHQLNGDKYTSNGILSGSAITMIQSVKNCVDKVGIDLNEALRMASLYPAKAIGINNRIGMIHKGYEESFVFLDEELNVLPAI
jgi:N-acetylglucosamine-6-phosphate deacetylase